MAFRESWGRAVLGVAAVLLCLTGAAPAMAQTIVNMNAITNATTDSTGQTFPAGAAPVQVNLAAGTYDLVPIGTADGGDYDAWVACTCNPLRLWLHDFTTSENATPVRNGSAQGYATAAEALALAPTTRITLNQDGWIKIFLYDTPVSDNAFGLSLKVVRVDTSALVSMDFNDMTPGYWYTQYQSGATISSYMGSTLWDLSGTSVAHGIQRSTGNWAPMIYGGACCGQGPNAMQTKQRYAVNESGTQYAVTFEIGAGVFVGGSQATTAADRLSIVLRNPAGQVVASHVAVPPVWNGAVVFKPASFTYTGDGTGNLRIEITAGSFTDSFSGTIDNLAIRVAERFFMADLATPLKASQLEDLDSAFEITNGALRRKASAVVNTRVRNYVTSTAADYLSRDWIYEVVFNYPGTGTREDIAFIGFGSGVTDGSYYDEPANTVNFRIHSGAYGTHFNVAGHTIGYENFTFLQPVGSLPDTYVGPAKATILKIGNKATFTLAWGEATCGTCSASYEVSDLATMAPFLSTSGSKLIFGAHNATGFVSARVRSWPLDPVPPVLAPTVTGTEGDNGWYTSDVALSWTVDLKGGVETSRTGCDAVTVSADTAGTDYTCTVVTDLGEASSTVTVKRDATAPSVSPALLPMPNAAGWNNGSVTVKFEGTDTTSGVATCTADDVVSAEGADQSSSVGICTDNAGNASAAVQATGINIDLTPPEVSATPSPQANPAGWHNTAVSLLFTATDGASGVAVDGCDAPVSLASSGSGQSASGSCTDRAGNTAQASASGINIDLAAPNAAASLSHPPNAANWHNTPVTVTFEGADSLSGSGLDQCSAAVVVSTDTTGQVVQGVCTDVAGNSSSPATRSIYLDQVAPAVTVSTPASGASFLQNAAVTAAYSCSDERSGALACIGTVQSGTALSTTTLGSNTFTVTAMDVAGNLTNRYVNYTVSAASAGFAVSPASLSWGLQPLNVGVAKVVTIDNPGSAPLSITAQRLGGTHASQFSRSTTCGSSLAAGASCTVTLTFRPTTTGAKSASLTVVTAAGTQVVTLAGSGVVPTYTMTPTSLAFGSLPRNTASAPQRITVSNTGTVYLPISSVSLGGTNGNQFSRSTTCGSQLPVGASCTVDVVFRPTSAGSKSARLSVTVGGGATSRYTTLSGTGL